MPNMQVSLIPKDHVPDVWEDIKPYIAKAAKYTYGRYTVDDILDNIIQYDRNLWMAFDDGGVKGVIVTYFKTYPQKLYLDLEFCAGDEGLTWKAPMLKVLQHWAYDNGCDGIESSGRLGWAKILKADGYKPLWQTYELPVADTGLGV